MGGQKFWYMYILASLAGTLYVGLADNLVYRLRQHGEGMYDGFTKKYGVNRLMYFETYTDSSVAARREKQIKKYRREKKIALFAKSNPKWRDLSPELFAKL